MLKKDKDVLAIKANMIMWIIVALLNIITTQSVIAKISFFISFVCCVVSLFSLKKRNENK